MRPFNILLKYTRSESFSGLFADNEGAGTPAKEKADNININRFARATPDDRNLSSFEI